MIENGKILEVFNWPRWMDKKTAARYCCTSTKQIERWINAGLLSFSRINNGHMRLDRQEIDRLFESKKTNLKITKNKILGGINNV